MGVRASECVCGSVCVCEGRCGCEGEWVGVREGGSACVGGC